MSIQDKLIERLLQRPTNFTYDEAKTLVSRFSYIQDNRGKTSGSRVAFVSTETKHIIRLHKPHPGNELKMYQIDELIEALKSQGLIE